MDSIRRVGALVMGILVLQLSLAAGPSPCAESAAVTETGHGDMSMPAESESCSRDAAGTGCVPSDHSACQAMMACMSAVFKPATQSQLTIPGGRAVAPVGRAALYATRTTVPDLPPPRA